MKRRTQAWSLIGMVVAVGTAGCDINGIGNGNRLESLSISKSASSGLFADDSSTAYLCFSDQLQAIGTFSNGGQGLYTGRGTWSSSDPSVVQVSNGDLAYPGDDTLVFGEGVIVPVAEGSATIQFDYVGLSASYEVTVKSISSLTVRESAISVAPETQRGVGLTATVEGYEVDASLAAEWTFDEEETDDIALLGVSTTSVFVSGVAAGGPLTLRAELPLCADDPNYADLIVSVSVAQPDSITLTREFVDAPNNELILDTTEQPAVLATFADGSTQNLLGQVTLESDNEEIVLPSASIFGVLSALAVGDANITAVYGGDDGDDEEDDTDPPEVRSNIVPLTVVERTLDGLSITPDAPTITALGSQQFEAIGQFDAGAATQPVTRAVSWDSSDTSVAVIGEGTLSGGLAQSLQSEDGAVTITATYNSGEDDAIDYTAETALCILTPASTPPDVCTVPDSEE